MKRTSRILLSGLAAGLLAFLCLTPAFAAQAPPVELAASVEQVVVELAAEGAQIQSAEQAATWTGQTGGNPAVVRDPATLTLLMDEAGLLTASEARELRAKLVELSDKHNADIVIVTVNSTGTSSPMAFADDYFDYNHYGRGPNNDGLLLLISMKERDWWISTTGSAINAFTDAGIKFIGESLIDAGLSDGNYARAFNEFADLSDRFFIKAASGSPFDTGNMPKTGIDLILWIVVGFFAGLIVASMVTGRMEKKLKSVQMQKEALDYILPGSFILSLATDEFLHKTVSQAAIPSSSSGGGGGGSSTHSGSSGSSHGGGGGKF